ncbi:MAG: phosphatidate cytidylyltransferase [Bacteroidota bacterium]
MKINLTSSTTAVLLFASLFLSSCQAIGDIFKAGVWVGVLAVVGVIVLIIYLVTRGKK